MRSIFERSAIAHPTGTTTALDHWSFEYYDIRLEGFGTSTGYEVRNRRHSALDLSGYIGAQPLCFLCFFAKRQRRPARQGMTSWREPPRNLRRNAERKGQGPERTRAHPLQRARKRAGSPRATFSKKTNENK
ncbi:MAG: hypothetical protein FWE28_09910 [Oscillospiraceae bacterium]|nr:hypothetical protein [Oscillospiraceae bacterium]